MPAIQPPAKVLVTGANGYLASWVVLTLLQRGYDVRGAVRTAEKGESLKSSMLKREPIKGRKFEYVVIPDICTVSAVLFLLSLLRLLNACLFSAWRIR